MIRSGAEPMISSSTFGFVRSKSGKSLGITVSYPNTSQSALPSCPPAPVIRMRISQLFRLRLRLGSLFSCSLIFALTCLLQACPVQLFIVLSELSGLDRTPPGLMFPIPLNRRMQSFVERHDGAPSEPMELPTIDRIPAVM